MSETGPPPKSERGLYAVITVAALVVIYVVAFVVSNSGSVKVSFVIFSGHVSLIWVMLFSIFFGIAIGVASPRLVTRLRGRSRGRADSDGAPKATAGPSAP